MRSGCCTEMKGNLVSLGVLPRCTLKCWIHWVGPHPHHSEALAPWRAVRCRPGRGKLSAVNLWMLQTPHLPLAHWTSSAHMYSGLLKVRLMLMRLICMMLMFIHTMLTNGCGVPKVHQVYTSIADHILGRHAQPGQPQKEVCNLRRAYRRKVIWAATEHSL